MLEDRLHGITSEVLGLRARLSQAWLAPGLLCLAVYIAKLQLLRSFLASTFKLVNEIILAESRDMTMLAERALQAPQEAVVVANRLIAASISSGIHELLSSLSFLLKAIEGLLLFALDMTIGTYACLSISAVNIAANEAINATEAIIGAANRTAGAIGKDINEGLDKLSTFINGAVGLIDSVDDFITGGSADVKSINLTVSGLNHLNLSSTINTKLEHLRQEVPTYDGTKAAVKKVISEPFKLLEAQINTTNITYRPASIQVQPTTSIKGIDLSKLQSDLARLEGYVGTTIDVLCAMCALAALSLVILELWKTKSRYRRLETAAFTQDPFQASSEAKMGIDGMQLIATAETPWAERLLLKRASQRSRWILRYIFHAPILGVLCLGLAGIVISLLELIVLSLLKTGSRELGRLASATTQELTQQVQHSIALWRNSTNGNIAQTERQVNDQILGWVHQGSQSVNSSISVFMTSINDDIAKVFNDTMFLQPLQAVVQCLIGSKVSTIEEGLTWIHEHSQISLPRIPDDLFAQNKTRGVTQKIKGEATKVFESALKTVHQQIVVQSIVSSVFIALWLVFVVGACVYAFNFMDTAGSSVAAASHGKAEPQPPSFKRGGGSGLAINVTSPRRVSTSVKSPIEELFDRVGHIFSGPAHRARVSGLPHMASIHFADSPKTPLRAAMF